MILKTMSIALMMFTLQACGSKTLICPKYPPPSQNTLNKISSLKDNDVNEWMLKQYKLNLKLKACNE